MVSENDSSRKGVVPLASAISALRDELTNAWWDARDRSVRFKPSPIELTLQVAVTSDVTAKGGVRWWLIVLGGDMSHQSAVTQTVKLNLEPIMFDAQGQPMDFLIDAADSSSSALMEEEIPLDAADQ